MGWRVAKSLGVLLDQINTAFPDRDKRSDGAIGDDDHANRSSDHNPWYGPGIVTAHDFTHDPSVGLDMDELTDQLAAGRDARIKYVIFDRWIMDSRPGNQPWKWVRYNGSNPHTTHMHMSVMASGACDSTAAWNLPMLAARPSESPVQGSPVATEEVRQIQKVLNAWYPWANLVEDGLYGPKTESAVRELQTRAGLVVDGIAGPKTRKVLGL